MKMISGRIVDVKSNEIYNGRIYIEEGRIRRIERVEDVDNQYILPGFIDAHIHIESSMMLPTEFARHSLTHGTVACICDPHEIANVCGVQGIDYMIENSNHSPMRFYFGAPSCVPSTPFETSGAVINSKAVEALLKREDIYFLAEMMNYPGVINKNNEVIKKLQAAKNVGKPIDGHAPNLTGSNLLAYAAAGISTDHECMTIEEARAKIALGMKVLIREGSAAKNFDDLLPLLLDNVDSIMFCSDDKHPDDLIKNGHIDSLVRRAVSKGYAAIDVLRACSLNPIEHYKLDIGLIQEGDYADFNIVDNLIDFGLISTYIRGEMVAENGKATFEQFYPVNAINHFHANKIIENQLIVKQTGEYLKVIKVDDGQLYTHSTIYEPKLIDENVVSDIENDILKLVVYNRYKPSTPSVAFIQNIGLKRGAIASTISHDSHNIVAVGTSDFEITSAINKLIDCKGGILATDGDRTSLMRLPVGGLMSDKDGSTIAKEYEMVDKMAKELGATLKAPFMTLSFMSLLVIPELKLGDIGLFDGKKFNFTDLME